MATASVPSLTKRPGPAERDQSCLLKPLPGSGAAYSPLKGKEDRERERDRSGGAGDSGAPTGRGAF